MASALTNQLSADSCDCKIDGTAVPPGRLCFGWPMRRGIQVARQPRSLAHLLDCSCLAARCSYSSQVESRMSGVMMTWLPMGSLGQDQYILPPAACRRRSYSACPDTCLSVTRERN